MAALSIRIDCSKRSSAPRRTNKLSSSRAAENARIIKPMSRPTIAAISAPFMNECQVNTEVLITHLRQHSSEEDGVRESLGMCLERTGWLPLPARCSEEKTRARRIPIVDLRDSTPFVVFKTTRYTTIRNFHLFEEFSHLFLQAREQCDYK